jgi:hypothetical protein
MMKRRFQKEYEGYIKSIVDEFSALCSVKMDYRDYCDYVSEHNRDERITFWHPHESTLIDMMLEGSLEEKGVKRKISERREEAKRLLSENLMAYDMWVKKNLK